MLRVKGDGKRYEFRLKGKTWQSTSVFQSATAVGAGDTSSTPAAIPLRKPDNGGPKLRCFARSLGP